MCLFAFYISGVLLGIIIIICDFRSNNFSFKNRYFIFILTLGSWIFVVSLTDIWAGLIINKITKLLK